MATSVDLRPSPIAGRWYPDDPARLAASVDEYLQAAQLPRLKGEVVAVIAPHAGYVYSGPTAGYAFAAVRGLRPEVVAVVSPMHYATPYPLLSSAHNGYSTPLGPVMVDSETLSDLDQHLKEECGFGLARVRRDMEHSLEIELPFLQRTLSAPFGLLPVMIQLPEPRLARSLGLALARTLANRSALLVASTDLSHFYPQAEAEVYDAEFLRRVEAFDPEGVLRAEEEGRGFACGRGAVAAVMWAALELGATSAQILHYDTSAPASGDYQRVVGYGAAALTRPSLGPEKRN